MDRETYTIDATNQSIGRMATKIAILLRGKQRADFAAHVDSQDFVVVKNIKKARISGQKAATKTYKHHTGYLGGLKTERLSDVFARDPATVLRRAVWGMLPKNRLRSLQIKRLKFE